MNIFVLHQTPKIAAQMHCDKHVVKMILESAQMLSSAHRYLDGNGYADANNLYRLTHKNHPCTKWVMESEHNYKWLYDHMCALGAEYKYRYSKTHLTISKLAASLQRIPNNIGKKGLTPFVQCMPDEYKNGCAICAYRDYYIGEKSNIAEWNKARQKPEWYNA